MKLNILATAVALPDRELLARLPVLAAHERSATVELVAHLAALRLRPSLYAAHGYGSLFAYCRHALRFSEDAASNRIHAARACLKFPVILDLLASGELSLSAVRMLRPHLTMENHERVLGRARNARKADIERLVAELAPRPDVPSSVRRLAVPRDSSIGEPSQPELSTVLLGAPGPSPAVHAGAMERLITTERPITSENKSGRAGLDAVGRHPADVDPPRRCPVEKNAAHTATPCGSRPVVQPLSPERYRVQFTIGQDAHDILRRLQTLLRREIPDGDAGAIFERAAPASCRGRSGQVRKDSEGQGQSAEEPRGSAGRSGQHDDARRSGHFGGDSRLRKWYPPRGGSKRRLIRDRCSDGAAADGGAADGAAADGAAADEECNQPTLPLHLESGQACRVVPGPGAVRVRLNVRAPLRRAGVPGAASHPTLRLEWARNGREHRASLSPS